MVKTVGTPTSSKGATKIKSFIEKIFKKKKNKKNVVEHVEESREEDIPRDPSATTPAGRPGVVEREEAGGRRQVEETREAESPWDPYLATSLRPVELPLLEQEEAGEEVEEAREEDNPRDASATSPGPVVEQEEVGGESADREPVLEERDGADRQLLVPTTLRVVSVALLVSSFVFFADKNRAYSPRANTSATMTLPLAFLLRPSR